MSHRTDDQALAEPIEKILEGMTELRAALTRRAESGNWRDYAMSGWWHTLREIEQHELALRQMKATTW